MSRVKRRNNEGIKMIKRCFLRQWRGLTQYERHIISARWNAKSSSVGILTSFGSYTTESVHFQCVDAKGVEHEAPYIMSIKVAEYPTE